MARGNCRRIRNENTGDRLSRINTRCKRCGIHLLGHVKERHDGELIVRNRGG